MTNSPSPAPTAARRNLYSGSRYERSYSYSRAVLTGNHVRISGTTGYDYVADVLTEGADAQSRQIFRNVEAVLAQVGGALKNVVRARIYIAQPEDYDAVMGAWAEVFRGIDPACTTVQAGLFDPDIKVEMDWDALLDVVA